MEEQNKESLCSSCFNKISYPCNTIFLIINAIFLIASTFWFVSVITLHYKTDECERIMTASGILVSFILLTMTLAGFYAAYFKSDCLFRIYFFIYFLWMFVLVAKAVFVCYLEKDTNPRLFPGTRINEYRLEDYSRWVRRVIIKENDWYRTKNCLVKENVCTKFYSNLNMSESEFYHMSLTPKQSGCCKPPLSCGFKYEKPNNWTTSKYFNHVEEDCKTWNNSEDTLCFDCNSCKAVTIADLHYASYSVTFNILHTIANISGGLIGWFAWLRVLTETRNRSVTYI